MNLLVRKTDGDEETISIGEYLRAGWVERGATFVFRGKELARIYFVSNQFGTVDWEAGLGLTTAHKWESESQAQQASQLNRHFTTILQDGDMPPHYAHEAIIRDILFDAPVRFSETVRRLIREKTWSAVAELREILSQEFSPAPEK